LGNRVRRLMRECGWSQMKDVTSDSFQVWRASSLSRQDRERIPHFHNVASQLDEEARAH
jgi:hypothetical protein